MPNKVSSCTIWEHLSQRTTLRVNGVDLFPTDQTDYALGCRVYQTPGGYQGWPTEEMLSEKLSSII
jgi:hypothetical protein